MTEKLALQIAVAAAGLVPVTAGATGALAPELLAFAGQPSGLTHAAYLSGLLLGIGLACWSAIPNIERQGARFTLITAIVVLGGLARLLSASTQGVWTPWVAGPLLMELAVTPALWLWQRRVANL